MNFYLKTDDQPVGAQHQVSPRPSRGRNMSLPGFHRKEFEARRDIVSEGDAVGDLHIIRRGLACRYQIMRDGSRRIVGFLFPGDACNADLFIVPESDHGIRTLMRTEVASISRQSIVRTIGCNPELARIFWSSAVQDAAMLRHWLVKMGQQKAYGRTSHLLFELFLRYEMAGDASANSFVLPLTQDELADTLGMTPVHVNRILQQLRHDGLISLQGRRLTITDRDGLEEAADFDSKYRRLLERTSLGELLGLSLQKLSVDEQLSRNSASGRGLGLPSLLAANRLDSRSTRMGAEGGERVTGM